MSAGITIDTREFQKALSQYAETTRKTGAQIVNQRAYNIAGRTMDFLKPEPGGEQAQRAKIKTYMNRQISTRIRLGKKSGKFRKRGSKANQLTAANLIIQARRARIGLAGLFGQAMRQAEGKFVQAAQVGVGSLKVPFVDVVRDLGPYQPPGARMKIKTQWGRIAVDKTGKWGRSGTVNPAKPGSSPTVSMFWKWFTKGTPTKVDRLVRPHLQRAFDVEAAELRQHVINKLQKEADKINARR